MTGSIYMSILHSVHTQHNTQSSPLHECSLHKYGILNEGKRQPRLSLASTYCSGIFSKSSALYPTCILCDGVLAQPLYAIVHTAIRYATDEHS